MVQLTILITSLICGMVVKEVQFDEDNLKIEDAGEFTRIRYSGLEITDEIGAPELPVQSIKIALPYGARIKEIIALSSETKELPEKFFVSWSQAPVILSQQEIKRFVEPKADIYFADNPYPEKIIQYKGTGIYDNQQICELIINPVQYYPKSKRLILYTSIKLAVFYEGGINLPAKGDFIKKMVTNPEAVNSFKSRQQDNFKYLIITNPPMDTVFQRLGDWKTKKGILTKLRTVNWILANYPGEDDAAKIRNYLKTLPDSSVEYVLLGGDTDIIPCRFAYAMTCSAFIYPGREDTMPCDLYYADLQGDWDLDNDGSYGEIEDSIDLYPDISVGRASVNTISEAQKFVEKILIYEKNPELSYLNNALFAAEILWLDPYTDQGIHKNKIGDESFPLSFEITKLYESLGNETPASVKDAIRQGQNLINHDGHGWINLMGVGTGYLNNTDFDTLTNTPGLGILYSIGCWTSAFDSASISEAFMNSPQGGGVAFIGNSSYGWGSPGNPGFGYSDRFDSRFFYSLLKEDNFHLGDALVLAKAHFIPFSREKNVYRWHQYEVNLLGDPELPVWTSIPETLIVSYPQAIPLGNSQILITVKDKNSGGPIKDALVCLLKGTESYASGYTDASGSIFLDATPAIAGNFDLTVTAHNYLCVETTIPVVSGAYVNYLGWVINDMFGNSDGIANPGENILLPTTIKNCGNTNANNILLKLRTTDPLVMILDSTAFLSSLNAGDSTTIDNAFGITIGSGQNGHGISFNLEITDAVQTLNFNPIILIGTPVLKIDEVIISSPPSLPNETESLYVNLQNSGLGFGHSTWAQLTSLDPYASIIIDGVWYGEIYPESLKIGTQPFVVSINSSCPASYLANLFLTIHADDYVFNDTIHLLIGQTGFSDDIESGTGLWTTGGTNNLWHISTRKAFSPIHAWYCGDSIVGQYVDSMNCFIQTIPFMVQENSILKFYRWFDVPLYGTDGIYVIIMGNGFADTLDFIGTGGALGQRDIQSDWFEEKYGLSQYPAGETIQIRISFISDNDGDVNEGFYIDNFNVEYITAIAETTLRATPDAGRLYQNFPNPFCDYTVIKYALSSKHYAENGIGQRAEGIALKIYNSAGQLVKQFNHLSASLTGSGRTGGIQPFNQVIWHGDDNSGRKLPAGVYFVRLVVDPVGEDGEYKEIEKVILLR